MGSAKVLNSKPQSPMADNTDRTSIKTILKSLFHKDKKKEKVKKEKETTQLKKEVTEVKKEVEVHNEVTEANKKVPVVKKTLQTPVKVNPVDTLQEKLQKLEIEKKKTVVEDEDEADEFKNFSFQVIEDDRRSVRIDSHSSEDSGFSESVKDVKESDKEVVEALENLKIKDDKTKKTKKLRTVFSTRGPTKKVIDYLAKPYPSRPQKAAENSYRQVNLNKDALCGGQVIVNATQSTPDNYSVFDIASRCVEKKSQTSQKEQDYWHDILEFIQEDTKPIYQEAIGQETKINDILSDFQVEQSPEQFEITVTPQEVQEPNPIEMFTYSNHLNCEDSIELPIFDLQDTSNHISVNDNYHTDSSIFPTPPRSENVPSPMSESLASFYPPNSDYTLSPERSSPNYNSDYEKYQDISHFDDNLTTADEKELEKMKPRERTSSICSMTMKQFKDMQKDIASSFSKKECCQLNRKPCREIFEEHLKKMKMIERKNACFKVANLDLKTAYGVLHHILLSLSRGNEQEDLQYSLFYLICERVLSQKPSLFADDFGLSLIKAAALRCHNRPLFTRYLVQCIRTALRVDATLGADKEYVFHEVDVLGDNLLIACARAGDKCANVLAELVRAEQTQLPLFRVHHTNTDGYTALHVACTEHSVGAPRLHIAHILLEHAAADLWQGDIKGGDTALHLAVNSANCDLKMIMIMFKHIDRKMWKKLAHYQNMSSVTPLEYARSATKSTTRQNYPPEVLDFLKKCR